MTARHSSASPSSSKRVVVLRQRVRTLQARERSWIGNALRERGEVFQLDGDQEVSEELFDLLADEPAVTGEVLP